MTVSDLPPPSSFASGDEASIRVAMRHDALLAACGLDGCGMWKRIIRTVDELLSKERPAGAGVH